LFSSLRSLLPESLTNYRFTRKPARVTLVVAGAAAALLAILVVALGLSLGGGPTAQAHGNSPAALAANSGAASGAAAGAASSAASKPAVAGTATRQGTPAPKQSPAPTPTPAQATAHHRHHHHHAAPQAQVTAAQSQPQPQPYLVYDSVNPQAIPGDPVVATYADGPNPDSPSSVANFSHVMWIDINASDPHADALDIEPGCATPSEAAGWVSARLNADPHGVAILYTMISQWQTVRDDVSSLPGWMQSRIRWWIADPTGSPHVVPGSQATQWYWGQNYDISTALPNF
jgi:hypothetical protein